MAILKNKTQNNFTMISNSILRDKELSMKDRGVLCTICSLPDGWEFSIAGLSSIVSDGKDSIRASLLKLEKLGYIKRTQSRGEGGKFISEVEVFTERDTMADFPTRLNRYGQVDTDEPTRIDRHGRTDTENPTQYNNDNIKQTDNSDDVISINQSTETYADDGEMEIAQYKEMVAENIKLDWLLEIAATHDSNEVAMVNEIYDVICDMVCYPRDKVVIKNTTYPWNVVKSRFLKLKFEHIADILNRLIDSSLGIKNMSKYLISALYTSSLVGTIEAQANLHDDYLKYLRGNPYK